MIGSHFSQCCKTASKYNIVTGTEISPGNIKRPMCVPCLEGKQQMRDKIPSQSKTIHPRLLYHVYSDLCKPIQTQLHQGKYYFLTFIDGNAHHVKVKLLVTKSKTCKIIIALIECAEVETGEWVNFFCSDGGGEFGSKSWWITLNQRVFITKKQTLTLHTKTVLQSRWTEPLLKWLIPYYQKVTSHSCTGVSQSSTLHTS